MERVAEEGDDRESPEVHEQIDGRIERHGGKGGLGRQWILAQKHQPGRDGHHHVSGVGDRRIGQQPLDIRLAIGGQIAEGASDRGQEGHEHRHEIAHRRRAAIRGLDTGPAVAAAASGATGPAAAGTIGTAAGLIGTAGFKALLAAGAVAVVLPAGTVGTAGSSAM